MNYVALGIGIAIVGVVCFSVGWLARHEAQCVRDAAARLRAAVNRELWRQERAEWEAAQRELEAESGQEVKG